jgi:hypothetical protein
VVGAGEADAWVVGEEIAALGRGWTGLTVHVGGRGNRSAMMASF